MDQGLGRAPPISNVVRDKFIMKFYVNLELTRAPLRVGP